MHLTGAAVHAGSGFHVNLRQSGYLSRHQSDTNSRITMLQMSPADLLSEFSIKIYEPPLSEMRDNGTIRDLSNPLSVVMLIVDFETEVSMNGINDFIGNSTGLFAAETVAALIKIGCDAQAERLQKILDIAAAAGMTHDAIQQDQSGLAQYTITSFSELHGDKWDAACDEIDAVESELDYSEIMARAETFVANHAGEFQEALPAG